VPPGPDQLAFDLPFDVSHARDDFLEGPCNAAALAWVERWPDWPGPVLALIGPPGSGKTHLAAIWAAASGAAMVAGSGLGAADLPALLAHGALVVDDLAPGRFDERALFHLLNMVREQGAFLLLTAAEPPVGWPVAIPDLASRLRAVPTVAVAPPDDALLRAVLVKLFADRQIKVDETLVGYLVSRIERSFAAARIMVERLDREALRLQRPVTRALAVDLLRADGI
jgi:chromosomal replication initiation ATPase DnaA